MGTASILRVASHADILLARHALLPNELVERPHQHPSYFFFKHLARVSPRDKVSTS